MVVKVVVFDVGGVLEIVDDANWPQQWLDHWADRLGIDRSTVDSRLEAAGLAEVGTGAGTERAYMATFQRALGLRDDQLSAMFADMWDRYCGRLDTELMGYVETLVPTYRVAIISNSGDGARREEERRYGFSRLFDPIVYSHEEGVQKPDPAMWALACRRIGAAPHEVALVDDVLVNVKSARAFGMQAIHHTDTGSTVAALDTLLQRAAARHG
jgi:HAD superfamily hydrolase (TIGR01549 family)